jgi:hypothetical protein
MALENETCRLQRVPEAEAEMAELCHESRDYDWEVDTVRLLRRGRIFDLLSKESSPPS